MTELPGMSVVRWPRPRRGRALSNLRRCLADVVWEIGGHRTTTGRFARYNPPLSPDDVASAIRDIAKSIHPHAGRKARR